MVFSQGIEPVVHGLPLRLGVFQGIHRLPQGIASGQARPLPPEKDQTHTGLALCACGPVCLMRLPKVFFARIPIPFHPARPWPALAICNRWAMRPFLACQ